MVMTNNKCKQERGSLDQHMDYSCTDRVSYKVNAWFTAKLGAHSIFCRATSSAVDHEFRLLRQAIIYSTNVLNTDGSQFCVQLSGRLLAYISKSPDK